MNYCTHLLQPMTDVLAWHAHYHMHRGRETTPGSWNSLRLWDGRTATVGAAAGEGRAMAKSCKPGLSRSKLPLLLHLGASV